MYLITTENSSFLFFCLILLDSSKDLIVFIISFISSFEVINVVVSIFLWIAASVVDAASVDPNGIKTLVANGLSTFFIKGNLVLSNGSESPLRTP